MNPAPQPSASRRRIWFWVLLGAGLCLTPFVLLGITAVSYLTLDSDVRTLRRHVMAATDADWSTKVQVSVGRVTLGVVGQALRFVEHKDMADARLALRSVKHASVGVYERTSNEANWSRDDLFVKTDRAMQSRGWTRLVGVAQGKEVVLVYVSDEKDDDDSLDICVAVVERNQLVVVSTEINASGLDELVARHAGKDLRRLRTARFRH